MGSEAIVAYGEEKRIVGRLIFERNGDRQHSTFIYAPEWLEGEDAFPIAPGLPLSPVSYHASGKDDPRDALPSVFADAAPDSYGRKLFRAAYGDGFGEFDFLINSSDLMRQGALRLLEDDLRPMKSGEDEAFRLSDLDKLSAMTRKYEENGTGSEEDVGLLARAVGSLGGARPKANVMDGGELWVAKFTSVRDTRPVERAEVAILRLAREVGLNVPDARLLSGGSAFPVALIKRFDRIGKERLGYMSARTALEVAGTDAAHYTDIADVIRTISADPAEDMRELWRRMVFSILVQNTDDHLRNHGFLHAGGGKWRLSPAFDVNAQPHRDPQMKTGISPIHGFEPSLEAAVDAAPFFDVPVSEASAEARAMAELLQGRWRQAFSEQGIRGRDLGAFSEVFEDKQSALALSPSG